MPLNYIKAIGFGATVLGIGANLVSDWVKDRKMNDTINETVDRALNERTHINEEDEDEEDEEES